VEAPWPPMEAEVTARVTAQMVQGTRGEGARAAEGGAAALVKGGDKVAKVPSTGELGVQGYGKSGSGEIGGADGLELREDCGEEALVAGEEAVGVELRVCGDEEVGEDAGSLSAAAPVLVIEAACNEGGFAV